MMDLTVIIPISKWNDETKECLDRALDSVALQTVKPTNIILATYVENKTLDDYISKTIEEFKSFEIDVKLNRESYSIVALINRSALNLVETKYFTILEPTDAFEKTWFENVERYISHDEDIATYLPIIKLFSEDGKFLNFQHATWWAQEFSELGLGYLSEETIKLLPELTGLGMVIRTSEFKEIGGLKDNIVLYYWIEFFLRLVYNKKNAFVIPKSLYNHTLIKPDLTEEEAKFYWEAAQQEYYFNTQRDLHFHCES